ncbi:uncharacterized protein E0L32_011189 [Thyridium curvatum]|uniref:Zn(2)-C6 fungal-type domain-containing protein n=1 Tax=Thyridium curvatum TaxID=1093900 RepID=A0A507BI42_9PEZI|nr:uncharacterized protein E0L32_011189 [Thyridium curvatum]TPX19116.1 hypothetical protein E0L32_011189 [Thyridium curvatum]
MPSKRKPVTASGAPEADNAASLSPAQSANASMASTTKRQRVSRACDQCRAAREKCDGIQPLCFPCVSQNRACTYKKSPKKRGVQTGYIRTLEISLAWLFDRVPGTEETLSAFIAREGGEGQMLLTGQAAEGTDRLQKRWDTSRVHKAIDRVLSGDAGPIQGDDQRLQSAEGSGAEEEAKTNEVEHRPAVGLDQFGSTPTSLDTVSPQGMWHHHASSTFKIGHLDSAPVSQPEQQPIRLRLPPNHWRLLDVYFSYTHSWLPLLEKKDVFQACYLYSEDELVIDPRDPANAVHAEIWSALALGSLQDAASSKPSWPKTPDTGSTSPNQIYAVARSLIPGEDGPFRLQHARAVLLLTLVNIGRENMTAAWILVGLAVRVFIEVGWHKESRGESDRKQQAALMACFILDTFVSVRYGRPPHLRTEYLTTLIPALDDDLDEWEPWAPCDGFGSSDQQSRLARNPAFGASTFSQLYKIFKVINKSIVSGKQDEAGSNRPADLFKELEQSIDAASPLARFINTPSMDRQSVAAAPSLYILRILYLWAKTVLGCPDTSPVRLLLETLGAFQARFGVCGSPPLITACLSSLLSMEECVNIKEVDMERLQTLRILFSSTWRSPDHATEHLSDIPPYPPRLALPNPRTHSHFVTTSSSSLLDTSIPFPTPTSSLYDSSMVSLQPHQASSGDQSVQHGHYLFRQYPNSAVNLDPAISNMPPVLQTDEGMRASLSGAPIEPPSRHLPTSFGFEEGASLDYDAILDDLAFIDTTDDLDVDPLFMANLGFGPGCDITDVMS